MLGEGEWRGLYLDNYAMLPHFRNFDDMLEIIINVHGPYRNFEWFLFFPVNLAKYWNSLPLSARNLSAVVR